MQFEQTVQKNQAANQDQLKQLTHHTQDTIKTIQLSHDEHLKQLHLNNQENIRALASQSSLIKELTEENQKHHIIYLEQIGKFLLLFEKNSEDRAALLNQKFSNQTNYFNSLKASIKRLRIYLLKMLLKVLKLVLLWLNSLQKMKRQL